MAGDPKNKKQNKYSIVLSIGGVPHKSSGETIGEAINKIELKKILGKCIITVKKGNKSHDMLLGPGLVKKLYFSRIYQQIFQKRADYFLQ